MTERVGGIRAGNPRALPAHVVSPARWHAQEVWRRVRLAAGTDEMRFVGALAQHVVACERCRMRWIGGDAPVLYLEKALRSSSAGDIWRAACEQERALRRSSRQAS